MAIWKSKKKQEEALVAAAGNAASEDVSVDDIMRKYDAESRTRIWTGIPQKILSLLMAAFSVYCIIMTLFVTALPETKLALFLAFIIIIGYLNYPINRRHAKPNHMPWYDIALMVIGAGCFFYFAINAVDIINSAGRFKPWKLDLFGNEVTIQIQMIVGVVGTLCLVELCRRCVGLPIIIVAGCLVVYAVINALGANADAFKAMRKLIYNLFYTTNGIIGTPTNVCYTYIVLFIIFGAFLERTGIAQYFISLANRIAGWSSGGAAKVAVISSALCGMVSGSSVGNTVTTGSVTIPMMKKTGYKPAFAAAVEAASSTGGQIMPPIMGAAAFLMAEYMGIPYIQVATIAIIPAILYFSGVFIAVHLEAKKLGLKGIPMHELPKAKYLIFNCYLILPLVLLVWLVASGTRTMATSAAISILAAFIAGLINFSAQNIKNREENGATVAGALAEAGKFSLVNGYEALQAGAKSVVSVAAACAMAGIIAGCITVTGLASVLINAIIGVAGNAIIIGLVLTMLCCIVLGMGVPTTANYCIMAATCAPILIQLGVPVVAAHFFVFYFGIVADITPPVALAAYAGSAIAKSKPLETALNATKIAIAAFLVPYVFALNPQMIGIGCESFLETIPMCLTALIGLFGVAVALNGNLFTTVHPALRVALAVAGIAMMVPGILTDVIGLGVIAGICVFQWYINRKANPPVEPPAAVAAAA